MNFLCLWEVLIWISVEIVSRLFCTWKRYAPPNDHSLLAETLIRSSVAVRTYKNVVSCHDFHILLQPIRWMSYISVLRLRFIIDLYIQNKEIRNWISTTFLLRFSSEFLKILLVISRCFLGNFRNVIITHSLV